MIKSVKGDQRIEGARFNSRAIGDFDTEAELLVWIPTIIRVFDKPYDERHQAKVARRSISVKSGLLL